MSSETATTDVTEEPGNIVADSEHEEILTNHSYDGIQEYDNPLPGWWQWLFILSVVFAPMYVIYFHLGENRSIHDQYEKQMADVFELRFSEIGSLEPDADTILEYMNKPKWLAVGKVVYKTNCVSCHGADGGGFILSSSNSIHSSINPANYLAMLSTIKGYGEYPIKLDFDDCDAVEAMT